jgi:molybdopterin converting factor small subunit
MNYKKFFDIVKMMNKDKEKDLEIVLSNCLISLNDEYVERDSDFNLKNTDEISIIAPISAG